MAVSNPPFFVTLFAGLLIAFALQLLLTNFGIAAGITALGYLPSRGSESSEPQPSEDNGSAVQTIGFALGFGTLLTVNTVLFIACFLAVKLSMTNSTVIGAILGIVIWSAYFLILVWLGSTAVGSILGSALDVLNIGWQGLRAIAKTVFGNSSTSIEKKLNQQIAAEIAAIGKTQRSLNEVSTNRIQESIKHYLENLQLPTLDLNPLHDELKQLINSFDLSTIDDSFLQKVDRSTLVGLISDRTDLSSQDVSKIVDELDVVWQEVMSQRNANQTLALSTSSPLIKFLRSAKPDELTSDELNLKLRQLRSDKVSEEGEYKPNEQAFDLKAILRAIRNRIDLSDFDVARILARFQSLKDQVEPTVEMINQFLSSSNTIGDDVEDYLLNAYPWQLTRKTVTLEFEDIIYDSEADPQIIQQQVAQLNRDQFTQLLHQRGDLSDSKINKIVDRLESVRLEVLKRLESEIAQKLLERSQQPVIEYLQSADKDELKPKLIQKQLKAFQKRIGINSEEFIGWLKNLDQATLTQALTQREDFEPKEIEQFVDQLEVIRDRLINETEELQVKAKSEAQAIWQKWLNYLGDRDEKLNARNLQRQLNSLLKETNLDLEALKPYLPNFNQEAVLHILEERQDLTEKRVEQIYSRVEKTWVNLLEPVETAASTVGDVYSQLSHLIFNYLQNIDTSNLDLDAIERDLVKLLNQPQIVTLGLAPLLTQVDWKQLMKQLNEQSRLTQEQASQVITQVQQVIYSLSKHPRRWAIRTQAVTKDFPARFEEYLQDADKEELNPEAIKQTFKSLLSQPQARLEDLGHLLSKFNRSTLMTLLTQRGDFLEEEASQIADQIEGLFQQMLTQLEAAQQNMQALFDNLFAKIRSYFDSLQLPELDLERIQSELRKLLDSPQAGFETAKAYLSELNRNTLASILSARSDISQSVTNQLIDQFETLRSNLIEQVGQLQQEAQQRLDDLKQQAQHQANVARKATAIAAWWLFGTAFTSMVSSAIAGALAVKGLNHLIPLLNSLPLLLF